MSHYAITKIQLKGVQRPLLKRALERLARRMDGQLVNAIEDYYGRTRTDFDYAIKTPKLYRGVGVRVRNGEVELIGDVWGYKQAYDNFMDALVMEYTAVAIEDAMAEMGMQVEEEHRTEDTITLRAYEYEFEGV